MESLQSIENSEIEMNPPGDVVSVKHLKGVRPDPLFDRLYEGWNIYDLGFPESHYAEDSSVLVDALNANNGPLLRNFASGLG